jgi:hypothetical protein
LGIAERGPVPQHARIVDVVVDQQPRLVEVAIRDQVQSLACGLGAVLGLFAGAEDAPKLDQRLLDALEAHRPLGLRSIQPPDAGVVALVPTRVLARERGLPDTAEPERGDRLGHGRGVAGPQQLVQRRQFALAIGEAGRLSDLRVHNRALSPPVCRPRAVGLASLAAIRHRSLWLFLRLPLDYGLHNPV